MKFTSPEFSHTIQDPTREPTGLTNRYFRNDKKTGAEMRPAIVSGIVIGDAPVTLLANFFPVPCNSPRSLYES